jgi:hypothetical protein
VTARTRAAATHGAIGVSTQIMDMAVDGCEGIDVFVSDLLACSSQFLERRRQRVVRRFSSCTRHNRTIAGVSST